MISMQSSLALVLSFTILFFTVSSYTFASATLNGELEIDSASTYPSPPSIDSLPNAFQPNQMNEGNFQETTPEGMITIPLSKAITDDGFSVLNDPCIAAIRVEGSNGPLLTFTHYSPNPNPAYMYMRANILGAMQIYTYFTPQCEGKHVCLRLVSRDTDEALDTGCYDLQNNSSSVYSEFQLISPGSFLFFILNGRNKEEVLAMREINVEKDLQFLPERVFQMRESTITVGRGTYGLMNTSNIKMYGNKNWNISFGSFCSIADDAQLFLAYGEHDYNSPSTFPFRFFEELVNFGGFQRPDGSEKDVQTVKYIEKRRVLDVGNDVWIGYGSILVNSIKIGHGAVIGAHSVVRHDVPPYAIVAGNPAQIIKYRFDNHTIDRLLELQWWDLPDTEIMQIMPWEYTMDQLLLYLDLRRGNIKSIQQLAAVKNIVLNNSVLDLTKVQVGEGGEWIPRDAFVAATALYQQQLIQ